MFEAHCPGPSSHRRAVALGAVERSQRSYAPTRAACSAYRSRFVLTGCIVARAENDREWKVL